MSDLIEHLRAEHTGLSSGEVLRQPVTALLGVSDEAATALAGVGIESVFDLGASVVFAQAAHFASRGAAANDGVPGDLLDPGALIDGIADASSTPLRQLRSLSAAQADALATALDVENIRDFAFWPPRVFAHDLVGMGLGSELGQDGDPDAERLRPRLGEFPIERVYYDTLVMLEAPSDPAQAPLTSPISLHDLAAAQPGFSNVAVGALATYSQSWFAQGITLGQMIHSLALAPGEATRIAVVDWSRRTSASAVEDIGESERLSSAMNHSRAISEVQNAVATEMQSGGSMSSGWAESSSKAKGGGFSIGGGIAGAIGGAVGAAGIGIGGSANKQSSKTEFETESTSWSVGSRSVIGSMSQRVNDRAEQHASSVRNRRASAIREVSQSEHEEVSTRVVANYNHMHALTVQYYEVVQVYRTETQLHNFDRVLFVPFELMQFDGEAALGLISRFRGQLLEAALTERVAELLLDDQGRVSVRGGKVVESAVFSAFAGTLNATTTAVLGTAATGTGVASPPPAPDEDETSEPERRVVRRKFVVAGAVADVLPGNAELVAIKFSDFQVATVRLDHASSAAADVHDVDEATQQVAIPRVPLRQLENIALALETKEDAVGSVTLLYESGGQPGQAQVEVSLKETTAPQKAIYLAADPSNRREELLEHLQLNRVYYTQAILSSLDSASLAMLLSGVSWEGKPLAEQVEPIPTAVAGNYLVLRAPVEEGEAAGVESGASWSDLLRDRGVDFEARDQRLIPIPTAGVFAEAVLGRSNSAEKLDLTRFWNWQDSPIPLQPTEISPVAMGSRATGENLTPGQLSSPVLNLMAPNGLPDPAGLAAVLGAVANGNMFRDMSGLAGTQDLAAGASAGTLNATTEAGKLATENYRIATDQATEMAKTAADMFKVLQGSKSEKAKSQSSSEKGAMVNLGREEDARRDAGTSGGSAPSGGNIAGPGGSPSGSGGSPSGGSGGGGSDSFSRGTAYADEVALAAAPRDGGAIRDALPGANEIRVSEFSAPEVRSYQYYAKQLATEEEFVEVFATSPSREVGDMVGAHDVFRQSVKLKLEQTYPTGKEGGRTVIWFDDRTVVFTINGEMWKQPLTSFSHDASMGVFAEAGQRAAGAVEFTKLIFALIGAGFATVSWPAFWLVTATNMGAATTEVGGPKVIWSLVRFASTYLAAAKVLAVHAPTIWLLLKRRVFEAIKSNLGNAIDPAAIGKIIIHVIAAFTWKKGEVVKVWLVALLTLVRTILAVTLSLPKAIALTEQDAIIKADQFVKQFRDNAPTIEVSMGDIRKVAEQLRSQKAIDALNEIRKVSDDLIKSGFEAEIPNLATRD